MMRPRMSKRRPLQCGAGNLDSNSNLPARNQFKKMFGQNGARHRLLRQILGLHVFGISPKNSVDPILENFRFLVRVI